jgi:hypothetical protein
VAHRDISLRCGIWSLSGNSGHQNSLIVYPAVIFSHRVTRSMVWRPCGPCIVNSSIDALRSVASYDVKTAAQPEAPMRNEGMVVLPARSFEARKNEPRAARLRPTSSPSMRADRACRPILQNTHNLNHIQIILRNVAYDIVTK